MPWQVAVKALTWSSVGQPTTTAALGGDELCYWITIGFFQIVAVVSDKVIPDYPVFIWMVNSVTVVASVNLYYVPSTASIIP